MVQKIPMTLIGFEKIQVELKHLKSVERPLVIDAIAEARAHGDLKENAEYHAAREKQSFLEGRIIVLEDITSRVEVIDPKKIGGDTIKFGATIKIVDEDTDEEATYQIVGEPEASFEDGLLALSAPLSRALIGKGIGDVAEVKTPKGAKSYEVLELEYV